MMQRRRFLQRSLWGGFLAATPWPNWLPAQGRPGLAGPLVVATWPNEAAVGAAWQTLEQAGLALDAVEKGAQVPEADPKDNSVGYGGLPDRTGRVTLDACIMDHQGNAGSVTYVQRILHPISLARRVMEKTPHVMLSGAGAEAFARAEGFPEQNLLSPQAKAAWQAWKKAQSQAKAPNHDTIGILAIDQQGRLAGACSTSGWGFKMPGRVGDSPIIGAGLFVDQEVGAATATGQGELMMKTLSAFLMVELMRQGATPQEACTEAIRRIATKYPQEVAKPEIQSGLLAVNKEGTVGAFALRPGFSYTLQTSTGRQVIKAPSYFP